MSKGKRFPQLVSLKLRSLSVGKKLILIYVFGIFVPLAVANGLVLRSVVRDVQDQERLFLTSTIDNVHAAVAREFEPIELVSEFVYADSSIYRLIGTDYSRFEQYVEAHRSYLVPALAKYANVFAGILRITVYTDNPIVNVSAGYLSFGARIEEAAWYRNYHGQAAGIVAMAHEDADPRTELVPTTYVSLFRALDNSSIPRQGRLLLRIDINPVVISRHLNAVDLDGVIDVVDPWGTTAATAGRPTDRRDAVEVRSFFSGGGALRGWSIRGIVAPVRATAAWSTRWTLLLVVSGLSIAVSSIFILLLSRSVTSRLKTLSTHMHRVQHEDFSPITIDDTDHDEVGWLMADYNHMVAKMDALINENYKSQIEHHQLVVARQQAELDALQSQVNPHFLYNVLESVRMKSHIKGEHETAQIVKLLSRSVRRLTSWAEDMVPIAEEIEFTKEYVKVQQYRFGERLSAQFDVDSQADCLPIPKLTIQSLVENACVHGLEPRTQGGVVEISVAVDEGDLRIAVEDDGVGCEPDRLNGMLAQRPVGSRHIGIANTFQRLRLHFGDRAVFAFSGAPGSGLRVEIRIRGVYELAQSGHR
ncbi:MAG: sensor histidine kinase [Spirochaetota bacterium]